MKPEPHSQLLNRLLSEGRETEWLEFKVNEKQPRVIGEYISALANSAALLHQTCAYLVWGVEDKSREVLGTAFKPRDSKVGNEELENWLIRLLSPRIDIRFIEFNHQGLPVVILEIQPAREQPVGFSGTEYIRVGTLKKKLKEYPAKEKKLWGIFSESNFEDDVAQQSVVSDDVLSLIDYTTMFELLKHRLPDNRAGIVERLVKEKVLLQREQDLFDITNIGALLFAKDLDQFERLSRKALRVIQYKGKNRVETVREQKGHKGYAVGFEGAIDYINNLLPQNEEIEQAFRKAVPVYPEIAIRELVANALIHQDFSLTGTGPMVEIFSDRIEITNPGVPLIDTLRFIDEPAQSRNEALAALMRRMDICEERGSGVDKVIFEVEFFQLPAPEFIVTDSHTRVVLYAPRTLSAMAPKDRIRACYQHACLRYVSNEQMDNSSFRKRLGIEDKNYATASRIIREAVEAELVRPVDPNTSKRYMKYVPFWA